jgi:hypothetical protein
MLLVRSPGARPPEEPPSVSRLIRFLSRMERLDFSMAAEVFGQHLTLSFHLLAAVSPNSIHNCI